MFRDKMQKEPTPERVYALCKFVQEHPMEKSRLKEYLEPSYLNRNPDLFERVMSSAEELGLVCLTDGVVNSLTSSEDLASFSAFRRLAARRVFSDSTSVFFRFTSWYLSRNESVFPYMRPARLASELPKDLSSVTADDILGWRFWASFLGIGVLHDYFLIPNMAVRLADALEADDSLPRSEEIQFSEFANWLRHNCPEAMNESAPSRSLCLGLSQGLLTLHLRDRIELQYRPDASDIWSLYQIELPEFLGSRVSALIVKE